jgi:hypothetical protein
MHGASNCGITMAVVIAFYFGQHSINVLIILTTQFEPLTLSLISIISTPSISL